MEDGTKWVMRIAGVDVERTLIRPEWEGHLTIQAAISSRTAYYVEGWSIANDVCPPMHRIVPRGYASR